MLDQSWPQQRLVGKLNDLKLKEKESWKKDPLTQPNSQKEIGPQDRDIIVEWISELTSHFNFHPETFFLATSILDRFITSVKAQPKYLKCIAISCFYLASKITEEENVVPCTTDLVLESKCGCRVCDVLRMERIILEKLSWNINSPTTLDYLHIFQVLSFSHFTKLSNSVSPTHYTFLSSELTRAMCDYKVAIFGNAVIALAVISLDLEFLTGNPALWTSIAGRLQQLAEVKTSSFMKCREMLFHLLSLPPSLEYNLDSPKQVDCEYDSDKTLTASEGEEDMEVTVEVTAFHPMTLCDPKARTYAEIVKLGASPKVTQQPPLEVNKESPSSNDIISDDVIIPSCGFQVCMKGFPPMTHIRTQAR